MNLHLRGMAASIALAVGTASVSFAGATTASVDLTALRAIQKYTLEEKTPDQVHVFVSGIAAGKEFQARYPAGDKTWPTMPKKPAIEESAPITIWSGTLNDGELAIVTVSVFQGEDKDPALARKYQDSIIAAARKSPEYLKPTLVPEDFKALTGFLRNGLFQSGHLVVNQQKFIEGIKNLFSRDKNTDHYCGLFNVILWNDGTAIRKRVIPIGVTFGEHYGAGVKQYTKLKYTRDNVFIKNENGDWSTLVLSPLSDDELTLRVKMLETESMKGPDGYPMEKTTDYLADLQVKIDGKTTKWRTEGEMTGVDNIHSYWEFAD